MPPAEPIAPPQRPRAVLAGALLAMVLAALDQNIVNTALPRIAADLGGLAHLSWVVTTFMLTATVTTSLYGRLSDIHGRRRLFFVAVGVFVAGSLACGLAQTMAQLIALRALQGLGAGGLLVLAQAAIGDVFSPRERPRYQGWITGAFAFASVAGPLVGGGITTLWSWRWVFFVNLPLGVLVLGLIAWGLDDRRARVRRPLDLSGVLLLAGWTATLLLLLAWGGTAFPWLSAQAFACVALFVVLFAAFVARERTAEEPVVRLGLLANPTYARGLFVGGMMTFAMMGSMVFLPLYFQAVLGINPAAAGAMLLPQVAGMMLTAIVGGRIVSRLGSGHRFLRIGVALEVVALASLGAFAEAGATAPAFLVSTFVLGLGMGMGMPNLTVAVQNAVPYRELGAATGMMTFVRSLCGALGVAISGAILARFLGGAATARHQEAAAALAAASGDYHAALVWCFWVSAAVMAAAWVVLLGIPDRKLRDRVDDLALD